MLELYHSRDAVCPMKVRVALAEKELEWTSHLGPDLRSPEYLRLNPNGYVPTLVHDGRVLVESRIISEYLEEAFPAVPLMPADPFERHQARLWSKQIDDSLHLNIFILTFTALGGWGLARLSPEERAARLPLDPLKREIALDLLAHGSDSQWVATAVARFLRLVTDMEAALATQAWLAGASYSLADIDLGVYAYRMKQMGLDLLWADLPNTAAWIDRVHGRPAFRAGVDDWLTEVEHARYAHGSETLRAIVARTLDERRAAA